MENKFETEHKERLSQVISHFIEIDSNDLKAITALFEYMEIQKKTTLVDENQISNRVYFILEGNIRFFYSVEGDEITGNIFTENMFAGSHESFLSQVPSKYTLESIEHCKVLSINYVDFDRLAQQTSAVYKLVSKVLERRLTLAHQIIQRLVTLSPEEHYRKILEDNPDWILRIPHQIIATYMGISPVSFSRIKKRVTG